MRNNSMQPRVRTANGAPGVTGTKLEQLRRSVMATLLFEDGYYETGEKLAERISTLACEVTQEEAEQVAIEARSVGNLRHVPLWILTSRMRAGQPVSKEAIEQVIQRADEPGEMVSMYWKDGKKPLPAQFKAGLRAGVRKFDAYQLGKYDRRSDAVKIRDVIRLVHPTPKDEQQSENWRKLIAGELEAPDTWEVQLSSGADKKETFERLLREGKLGYLALLRNLRNMEQAGVDRDLVKQAILARKGAERVLPFRFFAAAQHAPSFEKELDTAMVANMENMDKFEGTTVVCVDVSGSMQQKLSGKSELRVDQVAAVLASMFPSDDVRVLAFATDVQEVPHRRGMAGVDAVQRVNVGYSTNIGSAVRQANQMGYDRIIVLTDMQASDTVGDILPGTKGYMVNLAGNQNAVGFGNWVHIDGFSEGIFRFMREMESGNA